ncbi:MAG TPA: DUF1801 domain-containing protein [Xanthomonadaceae bacterium]|nr:DUF1801 domain-containing protein [Xanthomonadaceae bacterium]
MAELKTKKTTASVKSFLDAIDNEDMRRDARAVAKLMQDVTGEKPAMWGASMIGFGRYHYRYASGREGDWFLAGFAPRKKELTLYIMAGFSRYDALMARLGKFKTGKSCLYVKRLSDIDLDVLRELVGESVAYMKATYP